MLRLLVPKALDSVMNAECAVRTVGFFGPQSEGIFCCTNTESLSLWHAAGAQRIVDFGDVRALARGEEDTSTDGGDEERQARQKWGVAVDGIVGCRYEAGADRLRILTSGFEGGACVATVSPGGIVPEAVLEGGHAEQVRAFDWQGQTIVTGGEDAKVCVWRAPGIREAVDEAEGDGVAMEDVGETRGKAGPVTGGGRRAENRAGRSFRPYDTDDRRR